VYEAGAFERAERAELKRRGAVGVFWPKDAYAANLRKVRDPRAAEKAMPEADSVSYFLHQRAGGPVLGQVFHLTLRQGFRRWRRQLTVIYDEHPARSESGRTTRSRPGHRSPARRRWPGTMTGSSGSTSGEPKTRIGSWR
jgi:hypothetical protein